MIRFKDTSGYRGTATIAIAIFVVTLSIFLLSRVRQVTDSAYSMMLTQSLLDHRSFALDHYTLPKVYQLEVVDGHTYYSMPHGTSVLSAPAVWILNRFGFSAVNPDGTYNPRGEWKIQAGLAALLMSMLAVIFFLTARLLLTPGWSIVVAVGGALGTQVYSTASRGLWSETWGILLLGVVIFLLLANELRQLRLHPILFATLLSWMYFVRPTFAVPIVAITVYIFRFHRTLFVRYLITGLIWLAGFVLYSWIHYKHALPTYYRTGRMLFNVFWTALAGNLVSPSRGLLVFVPVVLFVGYLLVRYRERLEFMRLVWLALSVVVVHLIIISGFPHWWGGHSFGPRFTTGLVPWLVLLAILGVRAMLRWRDESGRTASALSWRIQLSCGALLLLVSVIINTMGATSQAAWLWNTRPRGIDEHPERLWDWRQPQFLASYLPYPPPPNVPTVDLERIDLTKPEADRYFWYGWNEGPPDERWTEVKAAMMFSLGNARPKILGMNLTPYLVPGKLTTQRVAVSLNGSQLAHFSLTSSEASVHELPLPADLLKNTNTLIFELPDANAPQLIGAGPDPRPRGIKLNWIQFKNE